VRRASLNFSQQAQERFLGEIPVVVHGDGGLEARTWLLLAAQAGDPAGHRSFHELATGPAYDAHWRCLAAAAATPSAVSVEQLSSVG
jgi:hypothetical protein